jgi:hypothetical protein
MDEFFYEYLLKKETLDGKWQSHSLPVGVAGLTH